ncbi:related to BRL1 - essential nuclear envelope integral membrane protein [Ustilago trichophora]|uniref:Related to BRL1 - essential nuclear envelope integral membrane protein n=1 Tax=Ustilago trichophora TaxID=86804 RepID=A0A5C3E0K6_9BASI|nr:related to BRL1 - essential nuclear envelope integral membrane protein [Ustilago trichophora]
MLWQRGTEAPMDTSPPGPPQPSIFDSSSAQAWSAQPSTSQLPMDIAMTDVEMSSLTPPSHRMANFRTHLSDPNEELADDSMSNADALPRNSSSKAPRTDASGAPSQHVRRKRSVLSRKGKRLAHLQSRELVPASRSHPSNEGDDDDEYSYDTDDEEEDDDEDVDESAHGVGRRKGTPSRIRSITKYAVNYIMPNSVSPLPHQPAAASSSGVHHMDKPELLLGYAQLLFNASILSTFLYLLYHVVRTVQRDVAEKVRAYEMDTLSEITACAAAYTANRCGTDLQAPALASACKNWERCSARDPAVVGTARVTAETFAEILNGFVDSVSWKTMFFTLICFSIVVGATNSFLSFFRIKSRSRTQDSDHVPHRSQHSSAPHNAATAPHAIGGGSEQGNIGGISPYYPPQHPNYPPGPHYAYPAWQQLPPSTPSRRRTRQGA